MSQIRADNITNRQGTGAPIFVNGIRVVGLTSIANIVANTGTFNGAVSIGGTLTYEDVTNVDSIGIVTARDGIDSPTNLVLRTGGNEKVRIDSSGNVLVGTTDTTLWSNTSGAGINLRGGQVIDIARSGDLQLTLNRMTNEGANIGLYQAGGIKGTIGTKSDRIYFGSADGAERLSIASAGQLGIGGANYGTSGQVLTSGGASAAPQWADAAGGMSEYDVWSVTSNSAETTWNNAVIGSGSPSAINIARQTTTQNPRFVKIGTGMSYASGIWTFPSTGYWEVVFRPIVYVNGGATLIQTFKIELTENNGTSWNEITRAHSGGGNNFEQPQTSVFNMVYITDVSNQKLRFIWNSEGSGHLQGAGGQLESNWVWKKVA